MASSDVRAASFAFGEADARAAALAWIRRRWIASFALARHASGGPIDSAWVPFWLIDAHAVAHWEGPGLRGIVEIDFVGLPVCAEASAVLPLMEALEPWPLSALRAHDARGNGGHVVMPASLSRDDAITLARTRMERDLIATARRSQPAGARDKIRMLGAEYPRESCGLALLPVWRFDDVRAGRRWRIAVNGVTGRTAGRRIA